MQDVQGVTPKRWLVSPGALKCFADRATEKFEGCDNSATFDNTSSRYKQMIPCIRDPACGHHRPERLCVCQQEPSRQLRGDLLYREDDLLHLLIKHRK